MATITVRQGGRRPLGDGPGRIVDPVAGTVTEGGVLIRDGVIEAVGDIEHGLFRKSDVVADARGALIAPGLVDVGVFAIDPLAASAGGITQ